VTVSVPIRCSNGRSEVDICTRLDANICRLNPNPDRCARLLCHVRRNYTFAQQALGCRKHRLRHRRLHRGAETEEVPRVHAAEEAAIPLIDSRRKRQDEAMDLLYWMDEQAKGEEKDLKFLAGILLKVSFAAIHTSAAAPAQLLFDLCERPCIIHELRREIASVMDKDGVISKAGFLKMVKMDSWMKEAQRFNPLLLITFERVVHRPFTLSSGLIIPAHTTIGIPTQAITMDPALYPDPETYDPWRFSKLREESVENEGKAQYVASNPASMSFGYGRHACPGRFFATQEIKAIMAHIIMGYDVRFSEGQKRPNSLCVETQYLPSPEATVEFRKR
jgi:cytochrome P450